MAGPDEDKKVGKADSAEVIETPAGPGDGSSDAHPSPHERQTEKGNSGTQGKSASNPDGEGVDKPYDADGQQAGSQQGDYGGASANADDFDGNNGCGNDTDFSDDNNGNCGGNRPAPETEEIPQTPVTPLTPQLPTGGQTTTGGGAVLSTGGTAADTGAAPAAEAQVMGIQIERAPEVLAATTGAQVLGTQIQRGAPAALAATGLPLGVAALAGFGLIGGGLAARRAARTRK